MTQIEPKLSDKVPFPMLGCVIFDFPSSLSIPEQDTHSQIKECVDLMMQDWSSILSDKTLQSKP